MGRSPCCAKEGMNRGAWTAIEDKLLIDCIAHHGEGKWRSIPKLAGLKRCGKSCRLRWLNYLRPDIKRGNIQPEEEDLIVRLHRLLGNRWSLIAGRLPGRTDNEIKNYWNTTLSKKANRETKSISNTIISRKKTMINTTTTSTTTGPPSSAVRTKAVKCNRVIITTTVPPPPKQTTNHHHQLEPVTGPGPGPNYSLDNNNINNSTDNNINNSRDNNINNARDNNINNSRDVVNVDIECYSSAAVDELLEEGDGDGGDLSLDDFPMDFHEVVEDQEMGRSDPNFWTLLNNWIMD